MPNSAGVQKLHQQRDGPADFALARFPIADGSLVTDAQEVRELALCEASPQTNGFEGGGGHSGRHALALGAECQSGGVKGMIDQDADAALLEIVGLEVGRVLVLAAEDAVKIIDGVASVDRHALLAGADHAERGIGHAGLVGSVGNVVLAELNHFVLPRQVGQCPVGETISKGEQCSCQQAMQIKVCEDA